MPAFNKSKKWLGLTSMTLGLIGIAYFERTLEADVYTTPAASASSTLVQAKPVGLAAAQERPLVRPVQQTWIF